MMKGESVQKQENKQWMISANPQIYRHIESFAQRGYIDWRQNGKYMINDKVYIYCAKPYMRVMFKTIVTRVNMKFEEITDDKEFWIKQEEYDKSKEGYYTRLKLLNEADNPMLSLPYLLKNGLKAAPQGPIYVNEALSEYLDKYLNDFYSDEYFNDLPDLEGIVEGLKKKVTVNKYERSSVARNMCIKYNGCYCHICGFDFEKIYGQLGKDFIHVHHIIPLSKIDSTYRIDYKNDLIPICPNCHAMIHRKKDGEEVTIEQLKRILSYYNKLKDSV